MLKSTAVAASQSHQAAEMKKKRAEKNTLQSGFRKQTQVDEKHDPEALTFG